MVEDALTGVDAGEHGDDSAEDVTIPAARERVLLALSMMSAAAAVLVLETVYFHVLTYVSNYQKAASIISVALLGIALGGLVGFVVARRGWHGAPAYAALLSGVAIALSIGNILLFPDSLSYPVLLLLPFLGVSTVISWLFTRMNENAAYGWELLGASIGVVAVCAAIPVVRSENVILLSIVLAGFTALLLAVERRSVLPIVLAAAMMSAGAVAAWQNGRHDFFNLAKHTQSIHDKELKIFSRVRMEGAKLMHVRDNLVGRVDIVKLPNVAAPQTYQQGVISDHVLSLAPRQFSWDVRVPNALVEGEAEVLVIGTSAEGVTKTGRHLSGDKLVGVEINPGIVDLMENELFEASGRAYENVDLHVTDARAYLAGRDRKFDIITMMNTHTRGRVSENVGVPQYLFTREGFVSLFEHLTERGALAIEEIRVGEQSDEFILRIMATAMDALEAIGAEGPYERYFYAYTYTIGRWDYIIMNIRRTPWSPEDIRRMDGWFERKRQISQGKIRRLIHAVHPAGGTRSHFAEFVRDTDGETSRLLREDGLDVSPITDDKPFLYDLDTRHGAAWQTFRQSIVATGVLIVLPCLVLLWRAFQGRSQRVLSSVAYFAALGCAYMLVELALMQKYMLFLGSPAYALIVVLAAILFFSSVGGLASRHWGDGAKIASIPLVAILLVVYPPVLDGVFSEFQGNSLAFRIVASLVTLAPLFFLMGVPFPYGMTLIRRTATDAHVALVYAVSGAFGTVGVTLSALLAVYYGFQVALLVGLALYGAAFLLVFAMKPGSRPA